MMKEPISIPVVAFTTALLLSLIILFEDLQWSDVGIIPLPPHPRLGPEPKSETRAFEIPSWNVPLACHLIK